MMLFNIFLPENIHEALVKPKKVCNFAPKLGKGGGWGGAHR